MEIKEIIRHLQEHISTKMDHTDSKTKNMISTLESITEEDIIIGENVKYFNAYIECNSTGVGESRFGSTKTQRTVALDYNTEEYFFVDGHLGAGEKGLSIFFSDLTEIPPLYSKDDIPRIAKKYGDVLHAQKFRDLNFIMTNHRLNRHKVHITKGPFVYSIRPILARYNDKGDVCTVGYLYDKDKEEHIIIEPSYNNKSGEKKILDNIGCSPWMLLGIFCPPVLMVAGIVMLIRFLKNS